MSQELYKLLPFLKPISGSAKTTAEQKTQALQRQSAEQIRQGGGLAGQTKTKELYKLLPFLQPAKTSNFTSGLESDKITVDGVTYDMRLPEHKKLMNLAIDKIQAKQKPKPIYESDDSPAGPPSPITDPRNSDYLSARKALTTDSSAADIKKVEDIGMTAWAKANPKLAANVKPGQSGYGVIQGLEKAKDQSDLVSDMQVMGGNKEESEAKAGGGSVEVDIDGSGPETVRIAPKAQAFKDDAMASLLGNYGNINYKPIVEGITLPTTTDYAGAFNQTDVPDLQSMMNMGEQLGNLGYQGPSFSQSFKDIYEKGLFGK